MCAKYWPLDQQLTRNKAGAKKGQDMIRYADSNPDGDDRTKRRQAWREHIEALNSRREFLRSQPGNPVAVEKAIRAVAAYSDWLGMVSPESVEAHAAIGDELKQNAVDAMAAVLGEQMIMPTALVSVAKAVQEQRARGAQNAHKNETQFS